MRTTTNTALPWYFGPYITTYNKEVFKRAGLDENMPPKTMDELFEDAAKVAPTDRETTASTARPSGT